MSWTTPKTWATDDLVTAALLNEQLRDNLNALMSAIVPTGTTVPYAGILGSAPAGWLVCDGSAVSRTTYADLFTTIGTSFGAGDGSATFNLPDLRGRFPLGKDNLGGTSANRVTAVVADQLGGSAGAENHTLSTVEMPAHNHTLRAEMYGSPGTNDSLGNKLHRNGWPTAFQTGSSYTIENIWGTSTTIKDNGGGGAHNNMPPYVTLNYIIKT